MKALQTLEAGDAVGPYVVQDLLGQGGMAAVYRVRHDKLGSMHALKVVTVPSRSVMRRLMVEGQVQARLSHRNIVTVTDVIEVEGCPGLVMEYVRGPSLHELLYTVELPIPVVDGLVRGLLRGLAAAHRAEVVHRDLKPANVLVALEDGELVPKIADFGLVKELQGGPTATKSGAMMGTPQYMAPEQIRSAKHVDERADLFAVGAILHELLTGSQAYPGDDLLDVFTRIAGGQREPLPDHVPARMRDAVDAALAVDLEERVASAEAMLEGWCGDVADADVPREPPSDVLDAFHALAVAPGTEVFARRRRSTQRSEAEERPIAPLPEPSSRVPEVALAGAALTGTGALALAGLLGAALIGVLGWWAVGAREVAVPVAAAPAPVAAPVAPVPLPAPQHPAPVVAPAPVAPSPAPSPVAPAPAPSPVAPKPVVPAPAPAPVPQARTAVEVSGDLAVMLTRADGTGAPLPPGVLDPGRYQVLSRESLEPIMLVTVVEGEVVKLDCRALMGRCKLL